MMFKPMISILLLAGLCSISTATLAFEDGEVPFAVRKLPTQRVGDIVVMGGSIPVWVDNSGKVYGNNKTSTAKKIEPSEDVLDGLARNSSNSNPRKEIDSIFPSEPSPVIAKLDPVRPSFERAPGRYIEVTNSNLTESPPESLKVSKSIPFIKGSFSLGKIGKSTLESMLTDAKNAEVIMINGAPDSSKNSKLSKKRANAITAFLVKNGVDKQLIAQREADQVTPSSDNNIFYSEVTVLKKKNKSFSQEKTGNATPVVYLGNQSSPVKETVLAEKPQKDDAVAKNVMELLRDGLITPKAAADIMEKAVNTGVSQETEKGNKKELLW